MLEREEQIRQSLMGKFGLPEETCVVNRARRVTAEVPRERLVEAAAFLKNELGFNSLCTITALDSGDNYEMIYHFSAGSIVLNLKALAPKTDPVFDTVTNLFNGATLYELEAHNLLGLTVRDIPEEIKYPLPDGWPEGEYPLRKGWHKEPAPAPQQGG